MTMAGTVPITPGDPKSWSSGQRGGSTLVRTTFRGTPAAVDDALWLARMRQQLVAVTRVPLPDGRVAAHVVLQPGIAPARPARQMRSQTVAVLAVLGALVTAAAVGSVVWAVWLAVAWVVAHWLTIVGTAVGLLVVWALLGMAGRCPGIHCPGCGCR